MAIRAIGRADAPLPQAHRGETVQVSTLRPMLLPQRSPSPPHEETRVIDRGRDRSSTQRPVSQDRPTRGSSLPEDSRGPAALSPREIAFLPRTIPDDHPPILRSTKGTDQLVGAIARHPKHLDVSIRFRIDEQRVVLSKNFLLPRPKKEEHGAKEDLQVTDLS